MYHATSRVMAFLKPKPREECFSPAVIIARIKVDSLKSKILIQAACFWELVLKRTPQKNKHNIMLCGELPPLYKSIPTLTLSPRLRS